MALTIVLPVRNMMSELSKCLHAVYSSLRPEDDVIVVDDASTDESALVARDHGAFVVQHEEPLGPYRSRNDGAALANQSRILFIDARTLVTPKLLDAHEQLLEMPQNVLAATSLEVELKPDSTPAARAVASMGLFKTHGYEKGYYLPYFPTANLSVERSVFEAAGGFLPIRGGADAEFCWRVQLAGHGAIGFDDRLLGHWIPRDSIEDLRSQFFRYGAGRKYLEDRFAESAGKRMQLLDTHLSAVTRRLARVPFGVGRRTRSPTAAAAAAVSALAFERGYRAS